MTPNTRTAQLHALGQSLWLDNITRALLASGSLQRYIDELSVTGLTSNPTIFDQALKGSADYDAEIRTRLQQGQSGEALFFELALEDLRDAFAVGYEAVADHPACECGAILRGVKRPQECRIFGSVCTPENPVGSCMVSSEGACAAHYSFGRFTDLAEAP